KFKPSKNNPNFPLFTFTPFLISHAFYLGIELVHFCYICKSFYGNQLDLFHLNGCIYAGMAQCISKTAEHYGRCLGGHAGTVYLCLALCNNLSVQSLSLQAR